MRKQFYTIQEVARMLQFSDQTIREWARDGRILTVRPGIRAYRIPLVEIERLLAQFMIDARVLESGEDTSGRSDVKSTDIATRGQVASLATP